MNDKTGRSSKLRLLLLFLMPGIIILTVVFEIQTNIEKNRANTDASVIINFMKEECVRYEKIYAQDDMEDQFSIEDILTGYKVERAGIIVLTDGERIISSNDLTMRGKTVAEIHISRHLILIRSRRSLFAYPKMERYIMVNMQNVDSILFMFFFRKVKYL